HTPPGCRGHFGACHGISISNYLNRSKGGFVFWAGVNMRRIFFLLLMLSSVGAWAKDYYWELAYRGQGFSNNISLRLSSPAELCQALFQPAAGRQFLGFRMIDDTSANCGASFNNGSSEHWD